MVTLLAVIALLALGYFGLRQFTTIDPKKLASYAKTIGAIALGGVALLLLVRGAVFLAATVGGLSLAVATGRFQWLAGLLQGGGSLNAPREAASHVTTKWLDLTLDQASGEISGTVRTGRFSGQKIGELKLADLVELRRECAKDDQQSAAILAAYLDRVHGDSWREAEQPRGEERGEGIKTSTSGLSADEAYDVLGLEPGASDSEIAEAHRRLMMLMHPDRGGSDYLAAKINAAKALLLRK